MFTIALIQNQSEMAHYGYADARPVVKELGYNAVLYTADNIDSLGSALSRNQFDAIIFASNALNDKTIRAEVESAEFVQELHGWLEASNGRGILCLHQLRLAQEQTSDTKFLPPPLNEIVATVRPANEKSAEGSILYGSNAETHTLLLYPNRIDPKDIQKEALNFRSLPGLYWHYWSNANLSDWEILLIDQNSNESQRPLLLAARDSTRGRIVVSSLTLDWQKQRRLLQNILTYVVEGRHNTAFLSDQDNRNTAFDYLIGTLQSRKYPFRSYFIGQDLAALEHHIRNNVHTILVLGPFVDLSRLSMSLADKITEYVQLGNLKLISIEGTDPENRRFSVSGRERSALRLLNTAELQIQSELRRGYIDGSFWSTAETLQTLQSIPQSDSNYNSLVGEALKLADSHDRDGSYDEVFGVTCAFLWMRGTYLGIDSEKTQASVRWIRSRISEYEPREQVQAYLTFIALDIITEQERKQLTSILARISPEQLSEIDIVVYLKAALISNYNFVINAFVSALEQTQKENGSWIDLATTATAIIVLIDALIILRTDSSVYSRLKPRIEKMLFQGVIHIQNSLQHSLPKGQSQWYPWDGKASTTAKCILSWLKFEDLIDLPVYELVETLGKYDIQQTSLTSARQALSVLEDLKEDNSKLSRKLIETLNTLVKKQKLAKKSRLYFLLMLITLYFSISILVGVISLEDWSNVVKVLKASFVSAWGFHLTVLGLVLAVLTLPIKKIFGGGVKNDQTKL